MSGLFGVLDVAARSMLITQDGVRTTGHNIANVGTPGYSRQAQRLEAVQGVLNANGTIGQGVEQVAVSRISDAFVQRELLGEEAAQGSLSAQSSVLDAVEEVFNEQPGGRLSDALGRLYSSFDDLASATTPGAAVEREAVLGTAQDFVDAVRRADARLRSEQKAADERVDALVAEINGITARISELNSEIVFQETVTPANDLRDQRDLLLRELARKVDIHTFEQDNGAAVVVLATGPTLVEGKTARRLDIRADPTNPFDPTFGRVIYDDGGAQIDVTADIGGGELGGYLRARDNVVASAIRSLDVLAYNVASTVNAVHQAGFGIDGSTGNDFFAPSAVVEDAARGLALDAAVDGVPDAIAAGGTGPAPGDNQNALALAALRDTSQPLFLPGDPPGPPTGPSRTLLDHMTVLVADVGIQARGMRDAMSQSERVLGVLEDRRETVSGVSLDEEVTNLVRLQATFQANARIVSVIDRLLQDVVSML
ncbi:MAG: flagellar hook-associated protein FlgK [Myxococcota bacterium]|nr:flagellar hook-associated protein FlgK [Myxococcota bacterium]